MSLTTAIIGLGTAVPEHRITQDDAAEQIASFCQLSAAQQQRLHQVHRQTGIATRHSVVLQSSTNGEAARQVFYERGGVRDTRGPSTAARMRWYEDHAGPLAAQAARRALERSAVLPDEVTHLVTVSCSGFAAPGPDYSLIQDLDLPRSVQRTHIGFMGCHGALNALRVAQAFCQADRRACVLIGAVELCTLHLQYGFEMQDVISNALFADGAAAAVCRAAELRAGDWSIAACGSHYLANSKSAIGWRIGDHGFEMILAPSVPRLIREHLRSWLETWLSEQGLALYDIRNWAVHPGGPRILDACRAALDLPSSALDISRQILEQYGNMSSPTILFVLDRLRSAGARLPAVALGFGPGLAIEAVLFSGASA